MQLTKLKQVFLIAILLLLPPTANAEEEFTTSVESKYDISPTGITTVNNKITITNLKKDVIATTYNLVLKQIDVREIQASDELGKLDLVEKKQGDTTHLELPLRNSTIGEGKVKTFNVSYKTNFVANKVGQIWNIQIPSSQENSTTQTLIDFSVPVNFGPRMFVSPTPSKIIQNEHKTTFAFEGNALAGKNITAAFGNYQLINFRIKYELANPNKFSSNYAIALPPTVRDSQIIAYNSIEPKPLRTSVDSDGNYLATFEIKPSKTITVVVTGSAKIVSNEITNSQSATEQKILSKKLHSMYTKPTDYWQTKAGVVQELAAKLRHPNGTTVDNARNIYNYLVENFDYDFEIAKKDYVDRLGAEKALKAGKGWGCMEFTDSFIAIARAMGIPAREINGYALSSNDYKHPIYVNLKSGDLLHAWPEFYDANNGWVQIDPTWGNTSKTDYFNKLDTNHLAFVIKGFKADYPLPAGTYRVNDNEKLVEVAFAQNDNAGIFDAKFKARKVFTLNIVQIIMGNMPVNITNTGNTFLYTSAGDYLAPTKSKTIFVKKAEARVVLYDALNYAYEAKL